MAKKHSLTSLALKTTLHFLFLAITLRCANTARIFTDEDTPPPVPPREPEAPTPIPTPVADVAPVVGPAATIPIPISPQAATSSTTGAHNPPLSFFMHDILGGSAPSGRIVAGITVNTQGKNLPFSKPNGGVFPPNGGVPLVTANKGIINTNNLPFVPGLNGATTSTVFNNKGNNIVVSNGNTLPFVTAGQLPQGATLQKLMFGTITVIDDELTEGHELGSSIIGKAQGFFLASSMDGNSHTMAFTAMFHNGDHDEEDTVSFFGVHRTAAHLSHLAIVGGTGKYVNAEGYATIETLHLTDQHTTDGVDTLLQFNVYLTH